VVFFRDGSSILFFFFVYFFFFIVFFFWWVGWMVFSKDLLLDEKVLFGLAVFKFFFFRGVFLYLS